jgi:hypothetical protein
MHRSVTVYGIVLIGIGIAGYVVGGMVHWTALIPAVLGVIAVAVSAGPLGRRVPAAAVAIVGVVLAALALFGSGSALADIPGAVAGEPGVNRIAVLARSATAIASVALLITIATVRFRGRPGT